MNEKDLLFSIAPWRTIDLYQKLAIVLKQEEALELPDYAPIIAQRTSAYEDAIRKHWEEFKKDPTPANAIKLAEAMKQESTEQWLAALALILGLNVDELTSEQKDLLQKELEKHHNYIDTSLKPDLLKAMEQGKLDFDNLDYRTIFLYAGALWSFGFLATVMFDGLSVRDLADLFIFVGPKDEATCTGDRGCWQHVNKIYTVAQILAEDIIPGHFRCLTSCRHLLLPILSPLGE